MLYSNGFNIHNKIINGILLPKFDYFHSLISATNKKSANVLLELKEVVMLKEKINKTSYKKFNESILI